MKTLLHVGCGPKRRAQTTKAFAGDGWQELRLDLNPATQPDIVGSMTDLSMVSVESVDAVFSSHNIEHLYPYEVPIALKEFLRVLKPDGFVVITCPDLRSICQLVADDKLDDVAYQSPSGPITPLDVLYGHGPSLERGDHYMAHRSGFTQRTITQSLRDAGFSGVATMSRGRPPHFDLWALATKATMSESDIRARAAAHFPI